MFMNKFALAMCAHNRPLDYEANKRISGRTAAKEERIERNLLGSTSKHVDWRNQSSSTIKSEMIQENEYLISSETFDIIPIGERSPASAQNLNNIEF